MYIESNKIHTTRTAIGYELSEDHKVGLIRERNRIEKHTLVDYLPLPASADMAFHHIMHSDVLNLYSNAERRAPSDYIKSHNFLVSVLESMQEQYSGKCFENGLSLLQSTYSSFDEVYKLFKKHNSLSRNFVETEKSFYDNLANVATTNDLKYMEEAPTQFAKSFIAKRKGKGPEAVFSRQNLSLMLTRSIGDRYGPRSCVGIPDVCAITIPATRHVRIIIASDGFWDVVSTKEVRCRALLPQYANAKYFAMEMVKKAERRRTRLRIRMDDITVICIDIHPQFANFINSKQGFVNFTGGTANKSCTVS